MKHVSEHKEFSSVVQLLASLQAEYDRMTKEHLDLCDKIRNPLRSDHSKQSSDTLAAILLSGEELPSHGAAAIDGFRDSEFKLRGKLEQAAKILRDLPSRVEYFRVKAARDRVKELESDFAKVHRLFNDAVIMLQEALRAEDAILGDLVAGGFGMHEPRITAPFWLNREEALLHPVAVGSKKLAA